MVIFGLTMMDTQRPDGPSHLIQLKNTWNNDFQDGKHLIINEWKTVIPNTQETKEVSPVIPWA